MPDASLIELCSALKTAVDTLTQREEDSIAVVDLSAYYMASENIELSEAACALVVSVLKSSEPWVPNALNRFVEISQNFQSDATIALRFATAISAISIVSSGHFDACITAGGIDIVTHLCKNRDELVQVHYFMNMLLL